VILPCTPCQRGSLLLDAPQRWVALGALAGLIATTSPSVRAQSAPTREPILRVETGMHTAAIKAIGVDRAGQFLVTASTDKTARVWEVASGRLLRVLRVPIGDGDEGKLYAVAISPDGRTIAAAGWTSGHGLPESVYLFARESGRLLGRLTGLPEVVFDLAFSPDGARLAATLGGANGVRIWSTSDWAELGRDTAYGERSHGADFDRGGRLVTSCNDGAVRLYDREMRLLAKRDAPGGKRPWAARFSPDGTKIAVGYDDSTKVDVLSGDTLAPLYRADTSGAVNGNMSSVTWSADGTLLYAGGSADSSVRSPIRRWSDGGRGRYVDVSAASDAILDLTPLPSGGIVYSAADPAWGVLDASPKLVHYEAGQTPDYRDNQAGFLADTTGSSVRFGYKDRGELPAVFHLADRTLVLDPPAAGDLRGPRIAAPGLDVTEWRDSDTPRLNSTSLRLDSNETSRSLAIAPDGAHVLLGSDWNIRLFDRSGREVWRVPAPSTAWAVNISVDGRYALAAYGDGTIRWHRVTDGKEVLAFFPHADRKRWVLWTPSGYYDASPGGEDLIGWHVNNGPDQAADFFPASQFRATYYRPDVVAQLLTTGDEARALELANAAAGRTSTVSIAEQLPPVVEIVSPADRAEVSATPVAVRFTVRTPSGEPVTTIRALVDGRPAEGVLQPGEGVSANGAREMRVTIPERDSEIAIIAENHYAASVPATVRLAWHGPVPRGVNVRDDHLIVKPKLYVLAIGVSQYGNPQYSLAYAAKDARDFVATMQTQKDGLYRDVVIYKNGALTDAAATKDEILDGLDWIRKETTSNDLAMVFLAGHGDNDQNNYYFFYPFNVDPDRLMRTGLPFSDLKNAVSAIAGKALFFVDTCHSGNALGLAGRRRGTLDINVVINELSSAQNGVVVFSASTGSESSYEGPEWNNGAFTKALVEGLAGAAAIGTSGRITYNMLNIYVSERVKDLTKGQQHPTMISPQTVPDFPIAIKK
jgi:WD40 repeat protein